MAGGLAGICSGGSGSRRSGSEARRGLDSELGKALATPGREAESHRASVSRQHTKIALGAREIVGLTPASGRARLRCQR